MRSNSSAAAWLMASHRYSRSATWTKAFVPSTMSARSLRSASASFTRRSSVSLSSRRARSARTLRVVSETRTEHSGDLAALVAHRRIGEGEPGLLVVALAVHDERQILAVGRMARHGGIDQRADVRPDLRPDVVEAPAQCARMLGAEDLGVRVVIEEAERVSPRDEHRETATAEGARRPFAKAAARIPGRRAATPTSRERASMRQCCRRPPGNRVFDSMFAPHGTWCENDPRSPSAPAMFVVGPR